MSDYPTIRIARGHDQRLRAGSPWLFSNELKLDEASRALPRGTPVRVMSPNGKIMGVAHFNPHSLIAARMLTRNKDAVIDKDFIARRITRALALRERLFKEPFYRLIHGEADGLPGLVIDRMGTLVVVQINTAGMAAQLPAIEEAVRELLSPQHLVRRFDDTFKEQERLPDEQPQADSTLEEPWRIEEEGEAFFAAPLSGQKTGWYFDQRLNRAFVRRLATDASVLDLYSYGGGFGLSAVAGGARSANLVDRSQAALALAEAAAEARGAAGKVTCERAEAFDFLERALAQKRRFDLVCADPPAFVKSRKDLAVGLRGYRKLARLCASVTAEAGLLCIACCSHNVAADAFRDEVAAGIRAAERGGRLLHAAGAAPDHPVHPALPETAYLKFLVWALD